MEVERLFQLLFCSFLVNLKLSDPRVHHLMLLGLFHLYQLCLELLAGAVALYALDQLRLLLGFEEGIGKNEGLTTIRLLEVHAIIVILLLILGNAKLAIVCLLLRITWRFCILNIENIGSTHSFRAGAVRHAPRNLYLHLPPRNILLIAPAKDLPLLAHTEAINSLLGEFARSGAVVIKLFAATVRLAVGPSKIGLVQPSRPGIVAARAVRVIN